MSTLQGHHHQVVFSDLEIGGDTLSDAVFEDCTFERCSFTDTRFVSVRFSDCCFQSCTLVGVRLQGCALTDVLFRDGRAMGVDWIEVRGITLSVRFEGVKLDYSHFSGLPLPGTRFVDCSLKEAVFSDADLSGARFEGCDLSGAVLTGCDLRRTDFRGSRGVAFDPSNSKTGKTRVELDTIATLMAHQGLVCDDLSALSGRS